MSRKALKLLQTLGLLDKKFRVADISRYEPAQLQKLVNYYASKRMEQINVERDQLAAFPAPFSSMISTISARNEVTPLLPSMLVYGRVFTDDPLFKLHRSEDEDSVAAYKKMLGQSAEYTLTLQEVSKSLAYFQDLAPLILASVLFVMPFSIQPQPSSKMPITYSEDCYRSLVPKHIHDFVHKNAIVHEVQPGGPDGSWLILPSPPATPNRGIAITFKNDELAHQSPFYLLQQMRQIGEGNGPKVKLEITVPWDKPPTKKQYDTWVYQTINQVIINRLNRVSKEMAMAQSLGATYLTESGFEAQVCSQACEDSPQTNAVNFLNANMPSLNIDSAETLAALRLNHADQFERFQRTLLAVAREMTGYEGNFDERAKELFEKEIAPQIEDIRHSTKKFIASGSGTFLVTGASVMAAVLSGASLPLSALFGLGAVTMAGKSLPDIADYMKSQRGPAYIWSKLAK